MVSQETQTVSCLLIGRTGLIGTFPEIQPTKMAFALEDGTPLNLIGFNTCHPAIISEFGKKKVAGFSKSKRTKFVSTDEWRNLTESANAVLFTRKCNGYEVEILERVTVPNSDSNGVTVIYFRKTGETDEFISCG